MRKVPYIHKYFYHAIVREQQMSVTGNWLNISTHVKYDHNSNYYSYEYKAVT